MLQILKNQRGINVCPHGLQVKPAEEVQETNTLPSRRLLLSLHTNANEDATGKLLGQQLSL